MVLALLAEIGEARMVIDNTTDKEPTMFEWTGTIRAISIDEILGIMPKMMNNVMLNSTETVGGWSSNRGNFSWIIENKLK